MGNVEVHDLAPVRADERKELNLSCKLTFKQFKKHKEGEMRESCLTELPWSIRDSVSLYERMDVSFNAITELPVELPLRLPHLSHLDLSYNMLLTLPESFGLLFHLKTVILTHNKLKHLPNSFTHLVKLEKLDLSYNAIRELPENLGTMESLRRLNVCGNKLKSLPFSLGACQNLTVILAQNNRLLTPPQSVSNEGSAAVISYLKKQCMNGSPVVPKSKINVFTRVRSNLLPTSCSNPQSAHAEYLQSQTDTRNTSGRMRTPLLPPLGSSTLDPSDLKDKIIGMIYGAAIGDAIGIATAYMTPDECKFYYDPETVTYKDVIRDEHRVHWRQGDWTDQFDQFCLVLDSVNHWGGVVDELDFVSRLSDWCQNGFKELGDNEGYVTSPTIAQVVTLPGYLQDPHDAAKALLEKRPKGHAGANMYLDNGALVRALALGIPVFHDLGEVTSNTARITKATHADPICVTSAVMLPLLIALMLKGEDFCDNSILEEMIQQAYSWAECCLTEQSQEKDFQHTISLTQYEQVNVSEEGAETYVMKPLALAIIALRKQTDFMESIIQVMMMGASSNVHCCIIGALIGCRDGYSRLPQEWLEGLRKKPCDWLTTKVNALLDLMGIP